jgi:hypothetical protein
MAAATASAISTWPGPLAAADPGDRGGQQLAHSPAPAEPTAGSSDRVAVTDRG